MWPDVYHRQFRFDIEHRVNSIELDHVDQYSCRRRSIFDVEQQLIVRRYLVDEDFSIDQAIMLKDHDDWMKEKFVIIFSHYHHLYDIFFVILPSFCPFVATIDPDKQIWKKHTHTSSLVMIRIKLLEEELPFLYYYSHHQLQDRILMNIHHNSQYQILYIYKPSIERQSMNHR